MRIPFLSSVHQRGASPAKLRGFTLPELLIAVAVFALVLTGVVFAHLFGLNMFRITETTLTATDDTRKVIGKMAHEIRTCKTTSVGNVNAGVFAALLDGEQQQGTALMIRPTTNSANFIIYFVNPSDQTFRRTTSTPGSAMVLAESITNSLVFRAQDYRGNVLTNNQNNRVIHINLEFFQPRKRMQVADYYRLETSVTRRVLE
jgi:prepilin-type N-terminal cleavage/methylation domain-containing protein